MIKHGFLHFLTGIIVGVLFFSAVPAIAAGVTAVLSSQPVTLNGKPVKITAYNIDGSNYFKLRDIAAVLDIGVWYDASVNTVRLEPDKKYDPDYTGSSGEIKKGGIYQITDYYADGKFSALGLSLPIGDTGERTLTVKNGDVLIVGETKYQVTAESIPLSFYTQPSHDKVIVWWKDYLDSLSDSGKVKLK